MSHFLLVLHMRCNNWFEVYYCTWSAVGMEQHAVKIKKCKQLFETNIYSYLETSGGQSSNLYLNVVDFFQHQC